MQEQNAHKPTQYVPGFHMLMFGVILAAPGVATALMVSGGISSTTGSGLPAAPGLGHLFFYTRQLATGNRDRLIPAEENLRPAYIKKAIQQWRTDNHRI